MPLSCNLLAADLPRRMIMMAQVATASMRLLSHRIAFTARRAARSQRTLASSRRAAAMASFKVMEVLNKANLLEASGASIMHMRIGNIHAVRSSHQEMMKLCQPHKTSVGAQSVVR